MTKEMISRIRAEIGSGARVIATGDHARLISEHVTEIEVVDCDLALHGLRLIYELNTSTSTNRGTGAEADQQLSGGVHG